MEKFKQLLQVIRKNRVYKFFRNALIGVVVLVLLFVAGGLAYTYLGGPEGGTNEEVEEESKAIYEPDTTPSEPAPDADVGVSVQAFTTPVQPGANASITVKTLKDAECEILVEYDEEPVEDSGLLPKVADDYGMASWVWTVDESAPEGEWPVEILCTRNDKSGFTKADLVIDAES